MRIMTLSVISIFLFSCTFTSIGKTATDTDEAQLTISGIKLGDDSKRVEDLLDKSCPHIIIDNSEKVSYPLAKNSERHLVCEKLNSGGKIAVTLADEEVVHVYSKGVSQSDISVPMTEPNYVHSLGYKVYGFDNQLWIKEAEKVAVLLSPDGIHPNLFVWKNTHIDQTNSKKPLSPASNGYPSILKFGHTFTELKAEFEKHCEPLQIRETEVWLLNSPKKQIQVNCFNYHYLGFPRKIEAVFGDDVLQLAWILSAKQEESRIRDLLIDAFGSPIQTNVNWDVFDQGRVFLRKDKPEVLAISDILVPYGEKNF